MAENNSLKEKSLLSLYIFEILRKFSNKESPMTEKEIKDTINNAEIFGDDARIDEADRKIIPRHIHTLAKHFDGLIVQVETAKNKAAKWYYDSSKAAQFEFLSRNNFTIDEIGFLIDMIYSSKLVTEKSTQAFIEKLLNSLNKKDEDEIKSRYSHYRIAPVKNENQYVYDMTSRLKRAIDEQLAIDLTLEFNLVKTETIKNASAYAINNKNGKWYVHISNEHGEDDIDISHIKRIRELGPATNYDFSILDKLEEQGLVQVTDKEGRSLDWEISTDTLFTNTRTIALATAEKRYLTFKDYKCSLADKEEEVPPRTVIPLTTIFKNNAYYLIAIEKFDNSENPVLIRIDLMEELKLGTSLNDIDRAKVEPNNIDNYLATDPYIRSKTVPVEIEFYIKPEAIQRAWDEFGDTAYTIIDTDPFDNTSDAIKAIGRHYAKEFTKEWTGFNYGDKLVNVKAEATEDDALRWALENADVVELKSPEHLRLKLLELTKDLTTRYSKSPYDRQEEDYRKILTGEYFLTYGTRSTRVPSTKYEDEMVKRISNEQTYDKVKKLKIQNSVTPVSTDELKKYTNLEELVIDGNGVNTFDWIVTLESLKSITLINTTIESGDILTKFSHLDKLFLSGNRLLENYEFLIDMKIDTLFIGKNGKADISSLYALKNITTLVIQENLLYAIDFERFSSMTKYDEAIQDCRRVRRWIEKPFDKTFGFEWPATYNINYHFLPQRKQQQN